MSSLGPYHILGYGTLLGSTVFHSFVGGTTMFRNLPRPMFGAVQAKIFPIYFSMQTVLAVLLALTYPGSRGVLASGISGVLHPFNRWPVLVPICTVLVTSLVNLVVVGPATTKCMQERRVQELKDGKKSSESRPHSEEMEALNRKFGMLHGASTLLNMGTLFATIKYGFSLGARIA